VTRITSTVLIFLLLLNGTAQIMTVSGLSDDIGVELNPGAEEAMDNAVSSAQAGFDPNVGAIESLVSFVTAGFDLFSVFVSSAWAAPTMLKNLLGGGAVVKTVVDVIMLPLYLVSTLELIYVATGRDTV